MDNKCTLKTYVESNKWIIESVERHIRNYCFTNDIKINQLESKNGWIMKTLYINLEGEQDRLIEIKKYIEDLTNEQN